MNKKKVVIIGSGAMGTAVGKVLQETKNNLEILVYGIDSNELKDLEKGRNSKYFDNLKFKPFVTSTNLMQILKGANYVVLAIPSKIMRPVLEDVLKYLNNEVLLINVSKGFYSGEKILLHEGIERASQENKYVRGVVSIIGPSHAEEIVLQIPTAVASVAYDYDLAKEVQHLFTNDYFRVYIQQDVKGAEAGAAYKNVLAIASGISAGLGYGINTTAFIMTRGLSEMMRFIESQGGNPKTAIGLTGIGDLIVTATSLLSRNYSFGIEFAKHGKKALDTLKTVEGLPALEVIYQKGKDLKLDLPIVNFLYGIIYGNKKLTDFKKELWSRELKEE